MVDALEVETLASDLEKEYKVKFKDFWYDDISLGETFSKINLTVSDISCLNSNFISNKNMHNNFIHTLMILIPAVAIAEDIISPTNDVREFIEQRDLCDHFRGEPANGEERRKFLLKNMIELCTGTDKQLMELKTKHKADKAIMKSLSIYEADIEPKKLITND